MSDAYVPNDLNGFFDGIGLCGEGRARAETLVREEPALLRLPLLESLFDGKDYGAGVKEAAAALGEDSDGMKMFVYLSRCALRTCFSYEEKGIAEPVYWATMKFLSRFLADDHKKSGKLAFRWGWWFPRQLSMREFRLGALEYETVREGDEDKISIHIPSDADLSEDSVSASLEAARDFFAEHFPRFARADMYCDSWMLAPALEQLLPAHSNILKFRRRFRILLADEDSRAFLEWIYPDPNVPCEQLPESTLLRRNVKKHLLAGGKVGWALGKLEK